MSKLPTKLKMIVHIETDGGFWVEFPTLHGCYTQGDSLAQLQAQVFDALLTYYDIPCNKAKKINSYLEFEGQATFQTKTLQPVGV